MPSPYSRLPAFDPESGLLNVIIETPRKSPYKYAYDEKMALFRLKKRLPRGFFFPYDFGFIPKTKGGDGDPLDILVLLEDAAFPGCLLSVQLIGMLEAEQREEKEKPMRNDRLIGTLKTNANSPDVQNLQELHASQRREIEHFFISYNKIEGKRFTPLGWKDEKAALALVKKSVQASRKPRA